MCAVLVAYHPDEGLPARLRRLSGQVGETLVIDNGSGPAAADTLRGVAATADVTLIENPQNLGLATALNIGVAHALRAGYAWALLLDQDTVVDDDIVGALKGAAAACPADFRVAVIGSRFRDTHGQPDATLPLGAGGEQWREVESAITSGSLLSLEAFRSIGRFRDEFFIDYVDTEYCLRARAAGYHIIETRRPLMSHTVGAPSAHRLLGRTRWTTNHSAERRYYIARNNTVLLREYGTRKRGSWRMKSLVRCFRLCKRIVLFEGDKLRKLYAVGQGWWDGVHSNLGPRR